MVDRIEYLEDLLPFRAGRWDRRGGAVVAIMQEVKTDTPMDRLLRLEGTRIVCGKVE